MLRFLIAVFIVLHGLVQLIGFLINVALLAALLVFGWPSAEFWTG